MHLRQPWDSVLFDQSRQKIMKWFHVITAVVSAASEETAKHHFKIQNQREDISVGDTLKNHTHAKKVGHTSEFLFGIYWSIWKTNNYLKNSWSGWIKNKIILMFTMLHFKKKYKEKHLQISLSKY